MRWEKTGDVLLTHPTRAAIAHPQSIGNNRYAGTNKGDMLPTSCLPLTDKRAIRRDAYISWNSLNGVDFG
ncbi:hypothetical protein NDI39_21905 [Microcoleus sp. ZQ-A2]|nr:hypothetical protein [Microcoleus sp. FACHB-1]